MSSLTREYTNTRTPRIGILRENDNPQPNNLDGLKLIGLVQQDGTPNPYITTYNLTGNGQLYGIIDGGMVLSTHVEFANETNRVLNQESGSTDLHATHVAGTSAAIGANINSEGVAGQVTIYSYSFSNPTQKFTNCGTASINAVNNSWGYYRGWTFESGLWYWDGYNYEQWVANYADPLPAELLQDPYFGKYTTYSQDIDNAMQTYPNMLMCFAAGNDRNDGSPDANTNWYIYSTNQAQWVEIDRNTYPLAPNADEGFNTMDTTGAAKNNLVVGASVDTSGQTTSFSGWGATNDLRIKPEVVANGENVFSCSNAGNTSYTTMSGTSMACPFATGCAILIQQFCQEQLSYFPISSTTKSCIIHGADFYEIPSDANVSGKHGYGIVNMNNTLRFLDEVKNGTDGFALHDNETMTNSDTLKTYTFTNNVHKSVVVTLCWNDVQGIGNDSYNIQQPSDKSIINRLALYVEHVDENNSSTFYYPYRITSYDADATMETSSTFDASKTISYDNTQKLIIPTTSMKGTINVNVLRDNTLTNDSQTFSLAVSNDTSPSCFLEGTQIVTDNDKVEFIENLNVGDYVKTFKHGPKKITHIVKKKIINKNNVHQIHQLNNGVLLTGGHSVLVDEENLPSAKYLGEGRDIDGKKLCLSSFLYESKPIENKDIYTVYHIVLEHHDPHGQYGIYVGEKNPILCETLSYYWYKKNN